MLVNMLIEPFTDPAWVIQGWQIKFMLSDKLLTLARKQSRIRNWYDDPSAVATWHEAINVCYTSIQKYHSTFGILPTVGDRLFNEDSGLLINDRSIDGGLMTITFTLDS
jgi:hypothetical protein